MDIINEKKNVRREMKQLRASISTDEKYSLDVKMRENLFASDIYKNAELILTFISVGDEPDTREILKRVWQDGKAAAVPKCLPEHKMAFFVIESFDDCKDGAYGIPEPKSFCKEANVNGQNVLCLVPGLAFDRKGTRLGYGGGYYDRFLKCHPDICALGYCAERFIIEEVPREETDIGLWGLITEKTVEVLYGKQQAK
jgi:5-formyltetrahydrofolate cyclo-ligase